jgi:CBS domain-containing protein
MLDRHVSRLVVVENCRVSGIVSRHDVLAALVRNDADILAAVRAVIAGTPVEASIRWGTVALVGRVEARSVALALVETVQRVDGVMDVDDDALTWDVDDLLPSALPLV